jgi:hypothetical protein
MPRDYTHIMEPRSTPTKLSDLSRTQLTSFNAMRAFIDNWGSSVLLQRIKGWDTSHKYRILKNEEPTEHLLSHPQTVGWGRLGWADVHHLGNGVFQLDFTDAALNLYDQY